MRSLHEKLRVNFAPRYYKISLMRYVTTLPIYEIRNFAK